MKNTARSFSTAIAGLSAFVLFTAASQNAHAALLDPGTPLDGTDPGGAVLVFTTTAPTSGDQYTAFPFTNSDMAVPGDIVILSDPAGGNAPSNWVAVARFFTPADPTGSQGLPATMEIGFISDPAVPNPTDFSTFQLFPNVIYIPAIGVLKGDRVVVTATFTEFGPAGAVIPGQSAFAQVVVVSPEPASAGLLAAGATLLLSKRRTRSA